MWDPRRQGISWDTFYVTTGAPREIPLSGHRQTWTCGSSQCKTFLVPHPPPPLTSSSHLAWCTNTYINWSGLSSLCELGNHRASSTPIMRAHHRCMSSTLLHELNTIAQAWPPLREVDRPCASSTPSHELDNHRATLPTTSSTRPRELDNLRTRLTVIVWAQHHHMSLTTIVRACHPSCELNTTAWARLPSHELERHCASSTPSHELDNHRTRLSSSKLILKAIL
jgi:hypothetical protein